MISSSEAAGGLDQGGSGGYRVDMLCWQRLYGYVRGHWGGVVSHEDARDVVQDVFCQLSRSGRFERAGRLAKSEAQFFAFLKKAARNRLIKNWRSSQARKRGGGVRHYSIDGEEGEWLRNTLVSPSRGEGSAYFKLEARVAKAQAQLQAEYRRRGKAELYGKLEPFLCDGSSAVGYAAMARELGASEQSLRTALSRARRRFRELLQ
ncbi:MAG: ECF-type sigma factor [Verrucomicrobiota bacterium]